MGVCHPHCSQQDSQQLQPTPQEGDQSIVTTRKPPIGSIDKSMRKPKISWPKCNDKDGWNSFDEILIAILQGTLKSSYVEHSWPYHLRRSQGKIWRDASEKPCSKAGWETGQGATVGSPISGKLNESGSVEVTRRKASTNFFRNSFKYARSLLEEKKSGSPQATKQEPGRPHQRSPSPPSSWKRKTPITSTNSEA